MGCISCGRNFHYECEASTWTPSVDAMDPVLDSCCCKSQRSTEHEGMVSAIAGAALDGEGIGGDEAAPKGRPPKDDATLTDPESTWRKRASMAFPLDRAAPCEWRGLADVGGGKYPIVGCTSGDQQAIHHGPVKITRGFEQAGLPFDFNREGNVHRVCARCHNLWHHWNDATYDPAGFSTLEHAPREAIPRELLVWSSPKTRPPAPYPKKGAFVKADD